MIYAFDCFGTVFDVASLPREDLKYYAAQLKSSTYAPLTYPPRWNLLKAHPDARPGIAKLRDAGHRCVTCSNLPLGLLDHLSYVSDIKWDAIVPVAEIAQRYKPHIACYEALLSVLQCAREDVLLVTMHRDGPDAVQNYLAHVVIRQPGYIQTIGDLCRSS